MANPIIVGLIGAILSVTGVYSYSQYSQTFGALPLIQSAQLAASPANGECLTTDGTNNVWDTCAGGPGGTIDGSGTAGQVAYWSDTDTLTSVATGTVSSANTALTVTSNRYVLGGSLSLTISTTTTTMFSGSGGTILAYSNALGGYFPQATSTMNVGTASALLADPTDCSAGSFPLGINAAGTAQSCTDAWTEAENTAAAYAAQATTLTVAGTTQQITSSAGAQSLAANRTWTLSLPSHVVFPGSINFGNSSSTNATSTSLAVLNLTAASCDVKASTAGVLSCGTDATGGASDYDAWTHPAASVSATTSGMVFNSASSTFVSQLNVGSLVSGGDVDMTGGIEATGNLFLSGAASEFTLGSAGAIFQQDADGALTIIGNGNGSGENHTLSFNLDDTLNQIDISSLTATTIDWAALNLTTSGRVTSGTMTVTSLTSALILTDGSGVFGEYAGATCTNQVVTAITAAGGATCTTLTSAYLDLTANYAWTGTHDFGGGVIEIPNGASPTVDAIGEIALDTTANELLFATSTNAGGAAVIKPYQTIGFTYSTTSWTGTTTILLGPADAAQDFKEARCETTTGTVNVSVYDGTNRMDLLNASSTIGIFKFATNNNFTAQEARRVDIGTPASSPVKMACTFTYTYVRN